MTDLQTQARTQWVRCERCRGTARLSPTEAFAGICPDCINGGVRIPPYADELAAIAAELPRADGDISLTFDALNAIWVRELRDNCEDGYIIDQVDSLLDQLARELAAIAKGDTP